MQNTLPQASGLARAVTEAEKEAFERDGVVLLKGIYPSEWVDYMRSQLDDVFSMAQERAASTHYVAQGDSERGSHSDMVQVAIDLRSRNASAQLAMEGGQDVAATGRSIVETDAAHWHRGLLQHHTHGPMPELIHQVTSSAQVNLYSDQLFLKEAGSRVKTPFHQDKPYFLVDGGDVAVAWLPVDTVTADNGAMGYVIGSHKWGKLFKPSDFTTENGTFPEVEGIDLSGLDVLTQGMLDEADIQYFDVEPGDVIVHHWATLHGSKGNVSAHSKRRAASIRYACEGCHFFMRPSSPEPFRRTVSLVDGDPLEKAGRFPIVWPEQA